jgi:hypothetical protein
MALRATARRVVFMDDFLPLGTGMFRWRQAELRKEFAAGFTKCVHEKYFTNDAPE